LSTDFQLKRVSHQRIVAASVVACFAAVALATSLMAGDSTFAQQSQAKSTGDKSSVGRVPGGVADGVPGGVAGGVPGRIPGGVPGGVAGRVPGRIPGGAPAGVRGGVPAGVSGGDPVKHSGEFKASTIETNEKQQGVGQKPEV